jgi:hypothetical protein
MHVRLRGPWAGSMSSSGYLAYMIIIFPRDIWKSVYPASISFEMFGWCSWRCCQTGVFLALKLLWLKPLYHSFMRYANMI